MQSEREVDWGASGRIDQYWFALVDPFTLQEVGTAVVKENASRITWSTDSENECEASLEMVSGNYLRDGQHLMVRPIHSVTIGSFCERYAMGTFFVSNLTNSSVNHLVTRKLTCYGPWYRYTQDVLPSDWVRHVGDNVVDGIRYIVESNGGQLTVDPGVDTERKHTMDFINVAGTNLGEMLRVFAGWINCEIVSDFDGRLVLRPYESPWSKAPVYTFEEGKDRCVYLAGLDWEVNRDEPINRVVAYFSREKKQDDDPYPLSDSVCVDVPPADAYSYDLTGRHRTQVVQVKEACSHEDLVAQAQRALDTRMGGIKCIKIKHAGIPWLHVGDCVTYRNPHDDENPDLVSTGVIQEMSVDSLGPMCMTTTKIRCYR